MTERRPHWDDDLIDSVGQSAYITEEDVYAVIAAVEDWQVAKTGKADKYAVAHGIGGKYLPEWIVQSTMHRALTAERAVHRVRELHHPIPGFNGSQWCGAHCEATADGDPTDYPCETIRALDGER